MAKKPYDATKEHAPVERSKTPSKGHPNKRQGTKHPVSGKTAR